jgi:bacillolysin
MFSIGKLKIMVKEIQIVFRRAITMISSNKLEIYGSLSGSRCISAIAAIILILNASAVAQNDSREIVSQRVNDVLQSVHGPNESQAVGKAEPVVISRLSKTKNGYLRFLGASPGHYFPVSSVVQGNAEATAKNFLTEHKGAFGTGSGALDLVTRKMKTRSSRSHVRFQQTYGEIPIFGAEAIVQLNEAYGVEYVLNDVMRDTELLDSGELPITPTILPDEAYRAAIQMVKEENPDLEFEANSPNLMIYEPSVVGNTGATQLVWQTTVTSVPRPIVAKFVLVDAHSGEVALHYSLVRNAKYREVYDAYNTSANPGILCREEGYPSSGHIDCDDAYGYLGDTYDFYYNYHGRDGIDDYGMIMSATVRYCNPGDSCPWPNAGWGSVSKHMYFGESYVVDDVTGHELTHGVTEYESGLLYQNESGAIDESFADMWGEWIDQTNGKGNDSLAVK